MLIKELEVRLEHLENKVDAIETNSKKALEVAESTQKAVAELLAVFATIKSGVHFFVVFVAILKWVAGAGIAFGVIWAAITAARTGKVPFVN